jgi:predicted PhzF superfamily epimerase YddE/YHI9
LGVELVQIDAFTDTPFSGHPGERACSVGGWTTRPLARGEIPYAVGCSDRLEAGVVDRTGFPSQPDVSAEPPTALVEALGVRPSYVGKNHTDYLVEVGSEREVREIVPDFQRLTDVQMRGVMVTALATPGASGGYDFVSRFFAPGAGVSEDPVTGSAHCCLGPFWRRRLGRTTLTGFRASARGGIVRLRVDGERVHLFGQAVTVMRADLLC